jgi:hypothetical protein
LVPDLGSQLWLHFRCARLLASERHCASRAAFRRGPAMSYHWHGALERTEILRVAKVKRKESDSGDF